MTAQAVKVLELLQARKGLQVEIDRLCACGAAVDRYDDPLPPVTLEQARACRAILIGNIGARRYVDLPFEKRPERTLMDLRHEFRVTTNLRPVFSMTGWESLSPIRPEILGKGFRVVVVRDIHGGMLAGPHDSWESSHGAAARDMEYYDEETIRVTARRAFEIARTRSRNACSLDKANVLASSVLWRRVVTEVGQEYPDVTLRHVYIDAASMEVIRQPWAFDVIVTSNVFGDIISDELAQISGTPALFGSAELAADGRGLYTSNQLHNPHEELAETGGACPAGILHATAMMLSHSLSRSDLADLVRQALREIGERRITTEEFAQPGMTIVTADAYGDLVCEAIARRC